MDRDAGDIKENEVISITMEDISARIEVDSDSKCAHWVGSVSKRKPVLYKNGRRVWVRTEVYKLRKGPIPRGFYVDMACKNWDCVNSRHMVLMPLGAALLDRDAGH